MRNIHICPCSIFWSATVNRSTTDCWAKKLTVSKQEKQNTMICLAEAIQSQLLVLKGWNMLVMPLFPRIDTSLPNGHAQFLSHQRNCLSHHSRSQIFESVHERNSLEPHSQTQNREKSYFFWVVGMFRSWGKDLLNCYSRWKLGPSFWTGDKSAIHGLTPPSISLVEIIKIFFVSGNIHDHGLLALWKSD